MRRKVEKEAPEITVTFDFERVEIDSLNILGR